MGWTTTGYRVYLGSSIGDEKRDFIIYADGEISSVTPQTRTVTQERAEWRALNATGAAAKTASSGWTIIARDRAGESAQWTVTEEKITYGEWTND